MKKSFYYILSCLYFSSVIALAIMMRKILIRLLPDKGSKSRMISNLLIQLQRNRFREEYFYQARRARQ